MQFVLDASIAITWAMHDEENPIAELAFSSIRTGSAVVPGIWWYEVRNILLVNERRGRITLADSVQFLQSLRKLRISLVHELNEAMVLELSRKLNLTVYDSAYLALAITNQVPLATLDKALRSAAESVGVSLLA